MAAREFAAGCAVFAALMLLGCDSDTRPDQWDAYIYSHSDDGSISEFTIRGFKTFELCQQAAQSELLRHGRGSNQDYQCGFKCGPVAKYGGLNACRETRR